MNRKQLLDPREPEAWAVWTLALTAASGAVASVARIAAHNWTEAFVWGVLPASFVAWLAIALRKPEPKAPEKTDVFRPFEALLNEQAWPRKVDVDQIIETVKNSSDKLIIVTGPSGAGKSTLLNVLVPPALSKDDELRKCNYVYVNASAHSIKEVIDDLAQSEPATVVVLDQFEQWLVRRQIEQPEVQEAQAASIRNAIDDAHARGCMIILGLRREWFYDLHFLGPRLPEVRDACYIAGPTTGDSDDETRSVIIDRIARVSNRTTNEAEAILLSLDRHGNVSPIEVQIVGCMLERESNLGIEPRSSGIAPNRVSIDQSIDAFFASILKGAPNPNVTIKVLCALSTKTRFRRQQVLSDIVACLFDSEAEVKAALQYLADEQHLVVRHDTRFALAHDYLAEYFNAMSASELAPVDRDNITAHVEARARGSRPSSVVQSNPRSGHRFTFGRVTYWILGVIMALRLLSFGVDWDVFDEVAPRLALNNFLLDVTYAPIIVPHFAWVRYIGQSYDRILSRIREGKLARTFSIGIVLNLAICVAVAMVAPFFWLLAIGWGGTLIGLKFFLLSRRGDLNRVARERLRTYGMMTAINFAFLDSLGIIFVYASTHLVKSADDVNAWLLVSVYWSVFMCYLCIVMTRIHVTPEAASQMVGLLARTTTRSAVPGEGM